MSDDETFPRYEIHVPEIHFPAIYEPHEYDNRKRYTATWHDASGAKLNASSNYAPVVSLAGGQYSGLVELLAICDARNIKRDKLFVRTPGVLIVRDFKYHYGAFGRVTEGMGRGLLGVRVVLDDLRNAYGRIAEAADTAE